MNKFTNFGKKLVGVAEKESLVGEVFSSVASKYDIMNDLMSLGVHRWWKRQLMNRLPKMNCGTYLDVACGSGDIAIAIHRQLQASQCEGAAITAMDINEQMLAQAQDKLVNNNLHHDITLKQGSAEALPFPDNSFDCYTISFGIRNVTNIDLALKEAHRVLKPGGKFLCLEFSKVRPELLKPVYKLYSQCIIPNLGELVTGDRDSYQYLVDSIEQFPAQAKFAMMIKAAGFDEIDYEDLTFGIAAIHEGRKL